MKKDRNWTRCKNVLVAILIFLVLTPVFSQTKTLTKEQYRDKTLAMVLGSIGGVLTGYEYLNYYNTPDGFYKPGATMRLPKEPILGLPEDWFILMNGTLGGTTKDEYNYAPWIAGKGRINSDDDQHIDFFNQYLLNQHGLSISYEDIKNEWLNKKVSDFGGGEGAMQVMRDKNLMAPQCGHRDHGNSGHWLPECYIEHEMMGAAFPGMPNKALEFTERFSSITGEGECVTWGYYWAAAHSMAFFETDIRTAIQKAVNILPGNSRPRQMYDICVMLKNKYPNDWRAAVKDLWKNYWRPPFAVGYDGVMMLGDVNNGTAFLSIMYGNNDYITTLKISSLAGGDGDCTASAVGGLLGIIKGMAGTPQKFKDDIYNNGVGVWINDVAHAFSIKANYKIEWKYDEIVDMYQQNAEASIRAFGGTVTSLGYTIKTTSGTVPQIATNNWDFENGDLSGWKTWKSGTASIWNEKQCNDATQACFAATGKYKGTINTTGATSEGKLFQTVTGLIPGATYKIEGRINAGGRDARLYVDNYGGAYQFASIYKGVSPFPFMYLYVKMGATNTSLDVGLHAPPSASASTWCSIDDIIITQVESPPVVVRYEAESAIVNNAQILSNASASGGKYIGYLSAADSYLEFNKINASYSGEYILRLNYANNGDFAQQKIFVNGNFIGLIEHSDTGPWGLFSANVTDIFVKLNKGLNTIRIGTNTNSVEVDYIDLVSPYGLEGKPSLDLDLVDGGIYKIINKKSQKVLDVSGTIANGSFLVQNTFTSAQSQYFKLKKSNGIYYLSPILNENMVVEINGAGVNNGDKLGLWSSWNGDTQQWAILDAGQNDGYYKIVNQKSGKGMDVAGGSTADGATVFQWEYLNGDNQKWRFDFVGTNTDNLPVYIPGKIEAEKYVNAFGIQKQTTTDVGGGENVSYIENGDWIEFNTYVNKAGKYTFTFRTASATAGGNIVLKSGNTSLATVSVTATGGWQTWKTTTAEINLPTVGLQTLRLTFTGAAGSLFNINWFEAQPFKDCAGVEFGTAVLDVCTTCVGGTTGKTTLDTDKDGIADCIDPDQDNDGVLNADDCAPLDKNIKGKAIWYADTDGDGFGDPAVTMLACTKPAGYVTDKTDACPTDPNKKVAGNCGCNKAEGSCLDCAGVANGTATLDACLTCVGGTTGKVTLDTDKDGIADCIDPDQDDDGVLNADDCAPLDPLIKGKTIWYADMDGDGFGDPEVTQLACTKPTGYVADKTDACPTDPNKKVAGNCGCNKAEGSCLDCAGVANGTATLDACLTCVGGTTGKVTLDTDNDGIADCIDPDQDNDGVLNADDCAPLDKNIKGKAIWYADTDGDGFGDPAVTQLACTKPAGYVTDKTDACPTDPNKKTAGNCGCNKAEGSCLDCAGVANGTATLDACLTCVGGTTGKVTLDTDNDGIADCIDLDQDNDGILNADDCAPLDKNIKGKTIWYADTDGDGFGDPAVTMLACTKPAGYVTDKTDACPTDPNKKIAGNCGCNKVENSCLDCAGVANGTAVLDNCKTCVGGTTGKEACTTDCAGVPGGTAYLDNCQTCVGGTTSIDACTKDCHGDFGGTASLDVCNICSGGNTGITPKSSIAACTATSIVSSKIANINVYPNPFADAVQVDGIEAGLIEIYDASGKRIYQQNVGGDAHISLSEYASGMYLLKFSNEELQYQKVLIKK
ncbi:carbohydrate-binding protein [uncultured Cytophaga sp.]|uniref:carbohydrate-binding protein n=1 Tax=uncultured Cytophaga sp. TaxID=160238 RepID=UPI00260868B9|nr:carbohydrate-binding protein [uncultured Cytophaga sp.]